MRLESNSPGGSPAARAVSALFVLCAAARYRAEDPYIKLDQNSGLRLNSCPTLRQLGLSDTPLL
jgi:hypothetical protein